MKKLTTNTPKVTLFTITGESDTTWSISGELLDGFSRGDVVYLDGEPYAILLKILKIDENSIYCSYTVEKLPEKSGE